MMISNGNRSVNVKRTDLLEKLKSNLAKHQAEVSAANEAFAKAGEELIRTALRTFQKSNVKKSFRVQMDAPNDYSEYYKRMISMLEMSTDDIINIGEGDFQKFVLDEWEWTNSFKAVTASYAGALKGA